MFPYTVGRIWRDGGSGKSQEGQPPSCSSGSHPPPPEAPFCSFYFQPAWQPGAWMVPGSNLADFVLPQDFLPQLFPVIQARVGNTRDTGLPIWSLQGDRVGWLSWQTICQPKGPANGGPPWTSLSQDAIGPALEQSDQKGAPDSCPDSQPAGDPRQVPQALCISISLVSTMTISGESPRFTSETP